MQVYGVRIREDRWAFKLAPQLTGRAQQAYTALNADDVVKYEEVKAAILRRYDISEETYRQRFRTERGGGICKTGNSVAGKKWMAGCDTVEAVTEVTIEQLLNTTVTRKGKVEGKEADDILLDTGCSRTMVQRGLVPEEKILEGSRSSDGQVCTWRHGAVSTSRGRDGTGWGGDDGAGCCLRHFASVGAVGNRCA